MPETYWIARIPRSRPIADVDQEGLLAAIRTQEALTVISSGTHPPAAATEMSQPWRCFRVQGPISHDVVGVLASITKALAEAQIPIFAISEFDTDYVLVPDSQLENASAALIFSGFTFRGKAK